MTCDPTGRDQAYRYRSDGIGGWLRCLSWLEPQPDLIHSFQQTLIECLHGPGPVPGAGNTTEKKTGKGPSLCGAFIRVSQDSQRATCKSAGLGSKIQQEEAGLSRSVGVGTSHLEMHRLGDLAPETDAGILGCINKGRAPRGRR